MTIDDERVRFYLANREQLEEWFALRTDVAAALDAWLSTLGADVEALGSRLGDGVAVLIDPGEQGWPGFYLYRTHWPDVDRPLIGLQWAKGKTVLGPSSAPYAGVRIKRESAVGAALRESAAFQEVRRRRNDTSTGWWLAYRNVLPANPFPEQSADYALQLLAELSSAWNDYASVVDTAVAIACAPAEPPQ